MEYEFLSLLKDARLNQKSEPMEIDYVELYRTSVQHEVSALIYNQIYQFPHFPSEIKNQWKKDALRINALQTIKSDAFLRIYQKLLKNSLKVIVVKGIVCRSLYPQPENRPSNDEDLYIRKEDFDKAKEIFLNEGFKIINESEQVTTFFQSTSYLAIELHVELFSKDNQAYGRFQNEFDHAFDHMITHQIQNVEVYSLDYHLHLLFLIMHFVKHFLSGGVGIRQVLDIIMYIEKYHKYISWNEMYKTLDELNVLTLIMNVYALAHQHLGFHIDSIPLPKQYDETQLDYHDLLDDILDAGVYGKSSMERTHSSTMTLNAVSTGKTSVLKSVFPSAKNISHRYKYLKKYPFLLPIAWINRLFHYLTNKNDGNGLETIELGNQRIELLKKYKIIN